MEMRVEIKAEGYEPVIFVLCEIDTDRPVPSQGASDARLSPSTATAPTAGLLDSGTTTASVKDIKAEPLGAGNIWQTTKGLIPNQLLSGLKGPPSGNSPKRLGASLDRLGEQLVKAGVATPFPEGVVVRNRYDQGTLRREGARWVTVAPDSPLHHPQDNNY